MFCPLLGAAVFLTQFVTTRRAQTGNLRTGVGHVEVQGRQLQAEGELKEEGMQSSIR